MNISKIRLRIFRMPVPRDVQTLVKVYAVWMAEQQDVARPKRRRLENGYVAPARSYTAHAGRWTTNRTLHADTYCSISYRKWSAQDGAQ
jgi:hypothetical protein